MARNVVRTPDVPPAPAASSQAVTSGTDDSRAQASIDVLIARFFSAFDNRNGARPSLSDVTDCFTDKATIVCRTSTSAGLYTVEEFATPRIELLCQGGLLQFHEWEVNSATQIFSGIAARTSRYCKSGLLNGNDYSGSGTKCFHLVNLGFAWRIAALAWVDDNS